MNNKTFQRGRIVFFSRKTFLCLVTVESMKKDIVEAEESKEMKK